MTATLPHSRPQATREDINEILRKQNVKDTPVIVGARGYYRDTMGVKGANDRGIYDDAIFIVSPREFRAFNANCDPAITRYRMANLRSGLWYFQKHKHKHKGRYPALGQSRPVTVERDQAGNDTGLFGINIHKGGWENTFSEGCQTLYPAQWQEFIDCVYREMDKYGLKEIGYLLVNSE
jgi:lysozyme